MKWLLAFPILTRFGNGRSFNRRTVPKPGEILPLDKIRGEVEITDGEKATLQNLVDISVGGVMIFTFSKAETPDCMLSNDIVVLRLS